MCEADNEIIPAGNETDESVTEQKAETMFLPDQFKTVFGKLVKLVGKQRSENIALLTYSTSKMQGNALLDPKIGDAALLMEKANALYDEGFLEEEDGNETDLIVLPIDAFELSPELKGVIVDSDLRDYQKGFGWLLDPDGSFIQNKGRAGNAMRAVLGLVQTIKHLTAKHCRIGSLDGHQFFFKAEYGSCRFVFDGVDILPSEEEVPDNEKSNTEDAVSAIIMHLLTGAWPEEKNDLLVYPAEDAGQLFLDEETGEVSGMSITLDAWNGLPAAVKDALLRACICAPKQSVSLDDWEQILTAAIAETEQCAFCGNSMFPSAEHCIFCGNTTGKESLLTGWVIQNEAQGYYLRVSFGRGTTLPGEILGINARSAPFMKIMYNSKANSLGIRNMSGIKWFAGTAGNAEEKLPGKVIPIVPELEIRFDGYPDVVMQFTGYEVKEEA